MGLTLTHKHGQGVNIIAPDGHSIDIKVAEIKDKVLLEVTERDYAYTVALPYDRQHIQVTKGLDCAVGGRWGEMQVRIDYVADRTYQIQRVESWD